MGAPRALPSRPQLDHRERARRALPTRTAPRPPAPRPGQRPDRTGARRSDHPPRLLRRVAQRDERRHRTARDRRGNRRKGAVMTTGAWTEQELAAIDRNDEVDIAPRRTDGSLAKPRIVWAVRVEDAVYIRSVNGIEGAWYR